MTRRKPRTTYHHGDLRRTLIEAALTAVERRGTAAITLRGVARDAGVSQAAPYNHFADKDALLAAVAAEGFRRFAAALDVAGSAASGARARAAALGRTYVGFAHAHAALFRLMFGPALARATKDSELAQAARASYAILQGAMGGPPGAAAPPTRDAPPAEALAAWALVHGLATLVIDGQVAIPAEGPAALFDAVIGSVRIGAVPEAAPGASALSAPPPHA